MADFAHATKRLILRNWRDEDWEPFWRHTNTQTVMRWLGGVCDAPKRTAAQERLLGYQRDHGHTFWAVERKKDSELLGFCGLKRCNQQGGPIGDLEVGWRLREDAWGRGYAREAAEASLAIAFETLGAPHVVALTVAGNRPSWVLMERLGMERREAMDFANADFDRENPVIIVYVIDHATWRARHA